MIYKILGTLYILAGIGKFIPYLESVEQVLIKSAIANKDNWLSEPTRWMSENYLFMTWWVAFSMILAGITIFLNRRFVKPALYGTLIMIACFMLVLYKSDPKIFIVDIPFIATAIYLLKNKTKKKI